MSKMILLANLETDGSDLLSSVKYSPLVIKQVTGEVITSFDARPVWTAKSLYDTVESLGSFSYHADAFLGNFKIGSTRY